MPSLEVVEVVLVKYNLVDKQNQQKPEVLYTFGSNKFYIYLLNVDPSNLILLQSHNNAFNEIIITFY